MTDKLIPYAVVSIVCLAAGAALMKSCDKPEPAPQQKPDTLTVYVTKMDTLIIRTKPRTEYVTVYRDTGATHHPCCSQLDDCTEQLWTIAGTELEARKAVDGGTVDVSFSMPVYLEGGDPFTARVLIPSKPIPAPVEVYRLESWTDKIRIGIHAGYGLGSVPGAQVGVSLQYSPWKLSDIWR